MMECGEPNLWGVHASLSGKGYSLEVMSSSPVNASWSYSKPDMCFQRQSCHSAASGVSVGRCDHCGAKDWELEPDGRVTQDNGRNCLTRLADGKRLGFRHCSEAHTIFNYVEYRPFGNRQLAQHSSVGSSNSSNTGTSLANNEVKPLFKDPESSLNFPYGKLFVSGRPSLEILGS